MVSGNCQEKATGILPARRNVPEMILSIAETFAEAKE